MKAIQEIQKVFVIGSGAMGTGIAQTALQSGFSVTLQDVSAEQLQRAKANIEKQLSRNVEKGRMTAEERNVALKRFTISNELNTVAEADLVIEAASEKMEVKKSIFQNVCAICSDEAVLATNTSSISITALSGSVTHPERFVGMHFFNPVPVMKLLELDQDRRAAVSALDARNRETLDYYTMWVHQIKTPIAAMGLILQDDETERGLALRPELFRVERYVELVLSYLRMGGGASDYVIRQVNVDGVLRQAVRKYAPLFIRGKVALDLEETGLKALSDEKWLQLVIEQALSNAVKYAPGGHVKVWGEGERLFIQDDGVGIAAEDLPRIFDRGFTGCNGRLDKRATGIGLYLCREICGRLGHTITVESEQGKGTRVTIGLARPCLEVE